MTKLFLIALKYLKPVYPIIDNYEIRKFQRTKGGQGQIKSVPENFNIDFRRMENAKRNNYSEFKEAFRKILNKNAPIKTTLLRPNNNPFKTKDIK